MPKTRASSTTPSVQRTQRRASKENAPSRLREGATHSRVRARDGRTAGCERDGTAGTGARAREGACVRTPEQRGAVMPVGAVYPQHCSEATAPFLVGALRRGVTGLSQGPSDRVSRRAGIPVRERSDRALRGVPSGIAVNRGSEVSTGASCGGDQAI